MKDGSIQGREIFQEEVGKIKAANDKENKELMEQLSHYIAPLDGDFKKKAKSCANMEELLALAKAEGIEFTPFQHMLMERIHEIEG